MLQLNFKEYGQGNQYLIILHGFLGSLDNWHTLATELAKNGLHVFSIDQRNHGKSPHTANHTLQLMVDDLNDFLFQQNIQEAIILGHSMGGKVAMLFSIQFPSLCRKLIVADIAPKEYNRGHDSVFDAIFQVNLTQITSRKQADDAMTPYLGDLNTRQFILKSLDRNTDGMYEWKFNLQTLTNDYDEIRKSIGINYKYEGETIFIKGGISNYIMDSDTQPILQLFPNATVTNIPNAGHWLHAEKPLEFLAIVLDFCKK